MVHGGASEASAIRHFRRWKEFPLDFLAPIRVEILFCGGSAAAKKIATESGTEHKKGANLCCSLIFNILKVSKLLPASVLHGTLHR